MSMKLRLELIERIEAILKERATSCAKDYLINEMFNFFDSATLIEFVEFLEDNYRQSTSNQN